MPPLINNYSDGTELPVHHLPQTDRKSQQSDSTPSIFFLLLLAAAVPAALSIGAPAPGQHSPGADWRRQSTIGGPLRGGDPGVALIRGGARAGDGAIAAAAASEAFAAETIESTAPAPPAAQDAHELDGPGLLLIPAYDPFIATDIDRASPLLAERAAAARLVLHPADAALLGLREDAHATLDGLRSAARVSLDDRLPRGIAGVSNAMLEPRRTPRRAKLGPA